MTGLDERAAERERAAKLADVWVPVPLRWKIIREGDVVVGPDGQLWHVDSIEQHPHRGALMRVGMASGRRVSNTEVPREASVPVLVLMPEAKALRMLREALAIEITEARRTG